MIYLNLPSTPPILLEQLVLEYPIYQKSHKNQYSIQVAAKREVLSKREFFYRSKQEKSVKFNRENNKYKLVVEALDGADIGTDDGNLRSGVGDGSMSRK